MSPIWPHLARWTGWARFLCLVLFGPVWPWLAQINPVWRYLAPIDLFGHIWPRLTPIGPFGPSLSCLVYNFLKIFCKRNINVLNLNLSKLLDQSVLSKNLSIYLDKKKLDKIILYTNIGTTSFWSKKSFGPKLSWFITGGSEKICLKNLEIWARSTRIY